MSMDPKTAERIQDRVEQSAARRRAAEERKKTAGKWTHEGKQRWNERCMKAYLKARPFEDGMDVQIHSQVLLMVASKANAAGISAGHAGKFAALFYDQLAPLLEIRRREKQIDE